MSKDGGVNSGRRKGERKVKECANATSIRTTKTKKKTLPESSDLSREYTGLGSPQPFAC